MPYNNSNALTNKEFYAGVARLLNVKPATAKRYWEEGFNEFIVREIFFKGSCRIPNLGTFTVKHMLEGRSKQTNADGEEVVYKVPERDIPIFTNNDIFINDVNNQGVTKAYRKRLKAGTLTERDYRRQKRAEELGDFGSMTVERQEKAKEDLKEMLQKKKEGGANGTTGK